MTAQPVEIELGYDRFEAMAIRNEAEARGYKVELLLMDSNGLAPGFTALVPHRMLVQPHEVDAVAELAERGRWNDIIQMEGALEDRAHTQPILVPLAVMVVAMIVGVLLMRMLV